MITKANKFNTGIASEYLILSCLYRLGLEAYITQGNKKSIDIRVVLSDGTTKTIDVKAVRGYSSLIVNNVEPREGHYLICVIYNNHFENIAIYPEIFIVPSIDADRLKSSFGKEQRIMKGCIMSYKDKWHYITEISKESPLTLDE